MRKLTLIAALSGLALPAFADDAALLFGVSRYDEFRRVSSGLDVLNAAGDLRDAGYEISTLSNGSGDDMDRLLDRFAAEATDAERLVVALAGRFVTDGVRSWFLAEDSTRPSPFGLDDAVSLEVIMHVLTQTPGQAILILGYDQGDDDAVGSYLREGVGTLDVPQGVTVLYGAPNIVDDVIVDAVTAPGGDVMAYVRDTRRLASLGFQPDRLVMQSDAFEAETTLPMVEPSLRAWNIARDTNTAESYRDFLFDNPDSPFAPQARARLDNIESDPVRLAELAEDGLNLTRNQRRAIQRNLTLLEFNTRGVDGIFGPGTRSAIRNWQQVNGYAQTSYLTTEQINRLDAQAQRLAAEIALDEERERAEASRLDRDYWEETGARGSLAGYRAYLERYPNGIFASEAREEIAAQEVAEPDNRAAIAAERALNINPVLLRLIENRLAQLGFNPGNVDGRIDNNTRRAISQYQARGNLTPTGYLDQATLARLLADTIGR